MRYKMNTCKQALDSPNEIKNATIVSLIQQKKWAGLEEYIAKDCMSVTATAAKKIYTHKFKCNSSCKVDHSMLHFICRYRDVPLSTVAAVVIALPEGVKDKDCLGRLPLHYATRSGVGPHIIRFLLEQDPSSGVKRDITGMTPLHFACKYFNKAHDNNVDTRHLSIDEEIKHVSIKLNIVLKVFLDVAPESLLVEDSKEMSALEYAIGVGLSIEIVLMMQNAIGKIRKSKASSNKQLIRLSTVVHDQIMNKAINGCRQRSKSCTAA